MDHPKDATRYRSMSLDELVGEVRRRGIDDQMFEREDDYILALVRDDRDRSDTHGEVE